MESPELWCVSDALGHVSDALGHISDALKCVLGMLKCMPGVLECMSGVLKSMLCRCRRVLGAFRCGVGRGSFKDALMYWLARDFVVRKVCVHVLGVKEGGCLDVDMRESGMLALAVFEVVLC